VQYVHLITILIPFFLTLTAGQATFSLSLNYPSSCFLRRLQRTILSLSLGNAQNRSRAYRHRVHERYRRSYQHGWRGRIWPGMSGMVKGSEANGRIRWTGSCRYCAPIVQNVRVTSLFVSQSHGVEDSASLFYTTPQPTTLNVLRQYALHVLFVPPAPFPAARSTALRPPRVTHSHSSTSRIHPNATASSCQRVGTVGEWSWFSATASTRKRVAKNGSAICPPTPEATRTATTAHEKRTHPSYRTNYARSP
jgi:hypothetical protein